MADGIEIRGSDKKVGIEFGQYFLSLFLLLRCCGRPRFHVPPAADRSIIHAQISYSWPIVPLQAFGRSKAKALLANVKLQQRNNGQHLNLYIVPPSASVIAGQTCTVWGAGGGQQQHQQQYSTLANVLAVKFIPKLASELTQRNNTEFEWCAGVSVLAPH